MLGLSCIFSKIISFPFWNSLFALKNAGWLCAFSIFLASSLLICRCYGVFPRPIFSFKFSFSLFSTSYDPFSMPFVLFPRIFQRLHVNDTHLLSIFPTLAWVAFALSCLFLSCWWLRFLPYCSFVWPRYVPCFGSSLYVALVAPSSSFYVFAIYFSFQCFIALSITFSCVQLCSS